MIQDGWQVHRETAQCEAKNRHTNKHLPLFSSNTHVKSVHAELVFKLNSPPATNTKQLSLCSCCHSFKMNRRCQHPSHVSSPRCPLPSPVEVYLLNTLSSISPKTVQWLDTSASVGPTRRPSSAWAHLHQRLHCNSKLERWQKKQKNTPWQAAFVAAACWGRIVWVTTVCAALRIITVKENNVFTWSFLSEGSVETKCYTKHHYSSPLTRQCYSVPSGYTSLPIYLVLSVEQAWSHCVFDIGWNNILYNHMNLLFHNISLYMFVTAFENKKILWV